MAHQQRHTQVECTTIDGTRISGWLYTVDGPAPAIIMSHGFNCFKEILLPDIAEVFQSLGYNVLLYDARSIGASGGQPRSLVNPSQMAEDLSDIYTYVTTLPSVNASKIVLWGLSFGATVSATSAAIDRRPKAVVMVCPILSYVQPSKADKAYAQLIKDRVSQLRGNEPLQILPYTPEGDNLIGMGGAGGPGGVEIYNFMKFIVETGPPNVCDKISFQTYQKLAMFRPKEYLEMIKVPVMMIIPELDNISPPEEQKEALSRVRSPKRGYLAQGKGHLNVFSGDGSKETIMEIAKFLEEALNAEEALNGMARF